MKAKVCHLSTTGSYAEYHFKYLTHLLEMYVLETTGPEVNLSDRNVLFQTLQRNTHIVAQYFDLRNNFLLQYSFAPCIWS